MGALLLQLDFSHCSEPFKILLREPELLTLSLYEGGRGGQSLPDEGLGSLPEENHDSRQDSQLEYCKILALGPLGPSHFFDILGSLDTETQGSMGPSYHMGGSGTGGSTSWPRRGRFTDPGLRSKFTSFSWKEMEDSERLSGEPSRLTLPCPCEQVVWCTITIARSTSRPGLRDLLLDFDRL